MRTQEEIQKEIKDGKDYLTWLMIQSPRKDYLLDIAKTDSAIQTLEWVLTEKGEGSLEDPNVKHGNT